MGFPRQEDWSGLPFPSPGDLPKPGIELESPTLQGDSLLSEPPGKHCLLLVLLKDLKFPSQGCYHWINWKMFVSHYVYPGSTSMILFFFSFLFLIGGELLYNVVSSCYMTTWVSYKYVHIPSLLHVPPIPPTVSALQVIREHWAELPVLHSSFPLASYFTYDTVYISLLLCQFVPFSPSLAVSSSSSSTSVSLLLLFT